MVEAIRSEFNLHSFRQSIRVWRQAKLLTSKAPPAYSHFHTLPPLTSRFSAGLNGLSSSAFRQFVGLPLTLPSNLSASKSLTYKGKKIENAHNN